MSALPEALVLASSVGEFNRYPISNWEPRQKEGLASGATQRLHYAMALSMALRHHAFDRRMTVLHTTRARVVNEILFHLMFASTCALLHSAIRATSGLDSAHHCVGC